MKRKIRKQIKRSTPITFDHVIDIDWRFLNFTRMSEKNVLETVLKQNYKRMIILKLTNIDS